MEQIILEHKTNPKKVSKFKIRETIVHEKEVTFNQLTKTPRGIKTFMNYRDEHYDKTGEDILDEPDFKLCLKSAKDLGKCLPAKYSNNNRRITLRTLNRTRKNIRNNYSANNISSFRTKKSSNTLFNNTIKTSNTMLLNRNKPKRSRGSISLKTSAINNRVNIMPNTPTTPFDRNDSPEYLQGLSLSPIYKQYVTSDSPNEISLNSVHTFSDNESNIGLSDSSSNTLTPRQIKDLLKHINSELSPVNKRNKTISTVDLKRILMDLDNSSQETHIINPKNNILGYTLNQSQINRLFDEIDTKMRAKSNPSVNKTVSMNDLKNILHGLSDESSNTKVIELKPSARNQTLSPNAIRNLIYN